MTGDLYIIGDVFTRGELGDSGALVVPPVKIDGFHVIASAQMSGPEAYLSMDQPPVLFFGATTYYYVFPDEGAAKGSIGFADGEYTPSWLS